MFIGQEHLKEQLSTLIGGGNLPHFIILVGARGQGKRLLAQYIAELKQAHVTSPEALKVDNIRGIITEAHKLSRDTIYLLANADDMTAQAENAILKLAEEPPSHCYIIMTIEDTTHVLPTILSRGYIIKMQPYTVKELEKFTDDDVILEVATNPGQIQAMEDVGAEELYEFVNKVVDNIGTVSTLNSLNIAKYVQLKDDQSGYPLEVFLNMIIYVARKRMNGASGDEVKLLKSTMKTVAMYKRTFKYKGISKTSAFDMLIFDLRRIWRG